MYIQSFALISSASPTTQETQPNAHGYPSESITIYPSNMPWANPISKGRGAHPCHTCLPATLRTRVVPPKPSSLQTLLPSCELSRFYCSWPVDSCQPLARSQRKRGLGEGGAISIPYMMSPPPSLVASVRCSYRPGAKTIIQAWKPSSVPLILYENAKTLNKQTKKKPSIQC